MNSGVQQCRRCTPHNRVHASHAIVHAMDGLLLLPQLWQLHRPYCMRWAEHWGNGLGHPALYSVALCFSPCAKSVCPRRLCLAAKHALVPPSTACARQTQFAQASKAGSPAGAPAAQRAAATPTLPAGKRSVLRSMSSFIARWLARTACCTACHSAHGTAYASWRVPPGVELEGQGIKHSALAPPQPPAFILARCVSHSPSLAAAPPHVHRLLYVLQCPLPPCRLPARRLPTPPSACSGGAARLHCAELGVCCATPARTLSSSLNQPCGLDDFDAEREWALRPVRPHGLLKSASTDGPAERSGGTVLQTRVPAACSGGLASPASPRARPPAGSRGSPTWSLQAAWQQPGCSTGCSRRHAATSASSRGRTSRVCRQRWTASLRGTPAAPFAAPLSCLPLLGGTLQWILKGRQPHSQVVRKSASQKA